MRIIGIDPGYARMGWGVIEKKGSVLTPVAYGAISTDKSMSMPDRLKTLYNGLMEVIEEYRPEEASIEELYFNSNAKTVIYVGEARGVAVLACANSGVSIYEYTPLQIKTSITGNGRADKKQVQMMVSKLIRLETVPELDDTADAIAAAICHSYVGNARKKLYSLR
jgi:crossover junction endodeoxyribonuclease RuvC